MLYKLVRVERSQTRGETWGGKSGVNWYQRCLRLPDVRRHDPCRGGRANDRPARCARTANGVMPNAGNSYDGVVMRKRNNPEALRPDGQQAERGWKAKFEAVLAEHGGTRINGAQATTDASTCAARCCLSFRSICILEGSVMGGCATHHCAGYCREHSAGREGLCMTEHQGVELETAAPPPFIPGVHAANFR